jgi:plastocyanin
MRTRPGEAVTARHVVTASIVLAALVGLAACGSSSKSSGAGSSGSGSSGASGAQPVKLGSAVTNKGTKDISTAGVPTLELELDDNYFKPTFIKAKPGSAVTVELKNEGSNEHTFTVDGTTIDRDMKAGSSASVQVQIPTSGALAFHCKFHGSAGMQGAFFTKTGAAVNNMSGTPTTASSGGGYGGYGG